GGGGVRLPASPAGRHRAVAARVDRYARCRYTGRRARRRPRTGDTRSMLIDPTRCAVLVIDMQRAFHTHVPRLFELSDRIRVLLAGALRLDVPIAYTQQYPEGLGQTV